MKNLFRSLYSTLLKIGFDPLRFLLNLKLIFPFILNFLKFKIKSLNHKNFKYVTMNAQLFDHKSNAGDVNTHYFWQDLIVAAKINELKIKFHNDIGSRIDGFIAHLSASNIQTNIFDIRRLDYKIPNVKFTQLDLMKKIPKELEESCNSLSCLHTLEHFGLGRYGDTIDLDGYILGLNQMKKLVKSNGYFFLSVPVGRQRVEFNAHRIFDPNHILALLKNDFDLLEFILIDDSYRITYHKEIKKKICNHLKYSCGIFFFKKK
jgi:hypothetical protein